MGNERLYDIMKEKDAIYMKEEFTDEDGIKAAELEGEFATMNGWEAESDAENLLNGLGIETDLHYKTDERPVSDRRRSKFSSPRHYSEIRISCSSTSRRTIWISTRSHGLRSS